MGEFITVAQVGDIPEGGGRVYTVADREVAVFLHHGQYYALDDFCPHMGASLGHSDIYEDMVVCNRHMWGFRLKDGTSPDVPSLRAETFEVRVAGTDIQVRVPVKPDAEKIV